MQCRSRSSRGCLRCPLSRRSGCLCWNKSGEIGRKKGTVVEASMASAAVPNSNKSVFADVVRLVDEGLSERPCIAQSRAKNTNCRIICRRASAPKSSRPSQSRTGLNATVTSTFRSPNPCWTTMNSITPVDGGVWDRGGANSQTSGLCDGFRAPKSVGNRRHKQDCDTLFHGFPLHQHRNSITQVVHTRCGDRGLPRYKSTLRTTEELLCVHERDVSD